MLISRLSRTKYLAVPLALSLIFQACKSTESTANNANANVTVVADSRNQQPAVTEKAEASKAEIASLRAEIQSLSERLRSAERNLEALQRGVRSGIWESQPQPSVDVPISDYSSEQAQISPPASSVGPTRSLVSPQRSVEPPTSLSNTEGSAIKRLASAEMKMTSRQFSEAMAILNDVEKEFPNLNDGGKTYLLSAECQLRLQKPDNALNSIRRFYLKYPKSPEMLAGKILEARAHADLGSHERAIAVYREIISLGPRTGYAQTARTAIKKLRDER